MSKLSKSVIFCVVLFVVVVSYMKFTELPKEHPKEILELMEFYKQAAKDQPAH